jgi:hypothetical protein
MYFVTKYASMLISWRKKITSNHNGHLNCFPFQKRKYLRFYRFINGLKNVLWILQLVHTN